MMAVPASFVPQFLAGFLVNIEIALCAVAAGLVFGLPLALLRQRAPALRRPLRLLVMLMQAAPVYVIMFFLLNIIPREATVLGRPMMVGGFVAVAASQAVNMVAYMCENLLAALTHRRAGDRAQALLLLPAILRGFCIVVMSSGFGAAIGVVEAVGVTLRQAQRLPELEDRVLLFAAVTAFFVVVLGSVSLLVNALMRRLSRAPIPSPSARASPGRAPHLIVEPPPVASSGSVELAETG